MLESKCHVLDTLYILLELGGMIKHNGYTDTTAVLFILTLHKAIEGDSFVPW